MATPLNGNGPQQEPVAWAGAITGLVVAGIPLLRAAGVVISEDLATAILSFVAAAIVVLTLVVRSKVTPTRKARAKITEAYHADAAKGEKKPQL